MLTYGCIHCIAAGEYPIKSIDNVTYIQTPFSPTSNLRSHSPNIQSSHNTDYDDDTMSVMTDHTTDTYNGDGTRLLDTYPYPDNIQKHRLGQYYSTAISGNDITSSILYTCGLVILDSGIWAPVVMLCVSLILYLFRSIYGEAITCLPLNGGSYTVLLNTTTKSTAAIAAVLTILSYVATAVVSATSAVEYSQHIFTSLPVEYCVIGIITLFAVLCLIGISESASVALCIFVTHIFTLILLTCSVIYYIMTNGFPTVLDSIDDTDTWLTVLQHNAISSYQPVLWSSIIYGFSSGMLGVTGFETSSNFVEEQQDGVFVKTLRNMWYCTLIFNPLITFFAISILTLEQIHGNNTSVLSHIGRVTAGEWLEQWVAVDATLVLSGSVLTAFIGVSGLCRRLASDRCLPQFLLSTNSLRGTNHWIIIGFWLLCVSIYIVLSGDVSSLANVYSVSFLSLMSLFAIGNMLLKYKRGALRRHITSTWTTNIIALSAVLFALCGVCSKHTSILYTFSIYFILISSMTLIMFYHIQCLKLLYSILHYMYSQFIDMNTGTSITLYKLSQLINELQSETIAFYTKTGKLSVLNKAILYVRDNENCNTVRIVHIYTTRQY